ncbi:MAG: transcriptional regulator [Alphaproteobacteria bacterium]|nr:transcriptional regulator [Alphaproteobacteria bacterium]
MARPKGKRMIDKKALSPVACDIVESLGEYAAYKRGKKTGIKTICVSRKVPENVDVKMIRGKLGMTQEQFTSFGFSLSAIRHWEARRRMPEGPARVLLMIIERNPGFVLETLHR